MQAELRNRQHYERTWTCNVTNGNGTAGIAKIATNGNKRQARLLQNTQKERLVQLATATMKGNDDTYENCL